MKIDQIEKHYQKFYESIGFERFGLFQCVKDEFGECEVAYLGSAAHITPSIAFSNVTYVDNNSRVKEFFEDVGNVTKFVEKRKLYRRRVNVSFIDVDYITGTFQNKYDLVIAIFSPGTFWASQKLLKEDSILLYLPLPSEKNMHHNIGGLKAIGSIRMNKGKYRYSRNILENTYLKTDMIDNKFHDVYAYSIWVRQ